MTSAKSPKLLTPHPTLVQTTCPYCGVGCGVDVGCDSSSGERNLTSLTGSTDHPANFGRLCVKGTHLLETNGPEGRLLSPRIHGKDVDWSTAVSRISDALLHAIDKHGPDAVGFYVSGQLLTEDYYVANKLMKGYIGSANIDTNSRLCMSSAVAAYRQTLGADVVPCNYRDLELADLLILVGSNAAWTHPVLFQRIERAKQLRPQMKVVVVDPRHTASCSLADMHLAIKPGSDVALFNGLLHFLKEQNALDTAFINDATSGSKEALQAAAPWSVKEVAAYCGLSDSQVSAFYRSFQETPKTVTLYSMGVNQSVQGVDKACGIINCHLATGRIGKPGAGPFSITGQPNAMGGREVGGLANLLAAHMDIDNPSHRDLLQQFWKSPKMATQPGLKAVDLFQKAADGEIKVLWIMATNPVVSMPNRPLIEKALSRCELVIVSDCADSNDTMAFADIALPATGWSEKDGTVTNSERRISRQRGILKPTGLARHDWQIICDVARHMGFDGFDYQAPVDIFTEHAKLSGYGNQGERVFDISALGDLDGAQYDNLSPIQWPLNAENPQGSERLFTNHRFAFADGKARFKAVNPVSPGQASDAEFPYVLNSGRLRDQWHTMTRTGKAPSLLQHQSKPYVRIHPNDMAALNIQDEQLVAVTAKHDAGNEVLMPALADDKLKPGLLFAPIHWSYQSGTHGSIAGLYDSVVDPVSGQPELKHGAVRLVPATLTSYGLLLSVPTLDSVEEEPMAEYRLLRPQPRGIAVDLAGDSPSQWQRWLKRPDTTILSRDSQQGKCHVALADGRLTGLLWIQSKPIPRDLQLGCEQHFQALSAEQNLSLSDISGLLQGNFDSEDSSPLVCQCFQVRQREIKQAIANGHESVESLGSALKCGTQCGSCKPELKQLISANSLNKAEVTL